MIAKKFTPNYLKHKHFPHGTLVALGTLTLCFVFSLYSWAPEGSGLFGANFNKVIGQGEFYRLFTATFAHGDLDHLLSNSLMLVFLSYFVYSFYGPLIFSASFIMSAIINLATITYLGGDSTLVGASGMVYFLWGLWLALYVAIQKNLSLPSRLLRVGALFLVLLIPTTYSPSTSYFAHYFGFALGALGAGVYFIFSPKRPSKEEIEEERNHVNVHHHKLSTGHPRPWEKDMPWESAEDKEEA